MRVESELSVCNQWRADLLSLLISHGDSFTLSRKLQEIITMFNFEKLDVWQKAINFADFVYSVTRTFPEKERFGLTSQMHRAAVSISSNVAEGSSRSSRSDFARFIELATGSLYEVVSQATIGKKQSFLSEADYRHLYQSCEEQSKMLTGLRRSLLDRAE